MATRNDIFHEKIYPFRDVNGEGETIFPHEHKETNDHLKRFIMIMVCLGYLRYLLINLRVLKWLPQNENSTVNSQVHVTGNHINKTSEQVDINEDHQENEKEEEQNNDVSSESINQEEVINSYEPWRSTRVRKKPLKYSKYFCSSVMNR